jgi:DNA-binding NarL/FixJ family response regulator
MKPARILIVDDHRIVRQGLRSILDPEPAYQVVGEAVDGESAVRMAGQLLPELVLLDVKLPDMDGVAVCRRILEVSPQTAVVILTAFIDPALVNSCLQAGARGYLLKNAENLNLTEHLDAVLQGYAALDPRAAGIVTDFIRHQPGPGDPNLRLRDIEILRLVAQGLTNREISARLYLSENTIKGYLKEIMARLGAHTRIEAVMLAKELGLL